MLLFIVFFITFGIKLILNEEVMVFLSKYFKLHIIKLLKYTIIYVFYIIH